MSAKPEKAAVSTAGDGLVPAGQEEHGGRRFMRCADGALLPVELVRPADRLRDDLVRDLLARAAEVSAGMAKFKACAFEELDVLLDLLASQYKVVLGGKKGNVAFETMDGCQRVQIAVADQISFGPELQVAKAVIDKLILDLGDSTPPVMLALVQQAFRVNKDQTLNAGALLGLRRIDYHEESWLTAMKAINDSIKVTGSKRYIRFHTRPNPEAAWTAVPMDISVA